MWWRQGSRRVLEEREVGEWVGEEAFGRPCLLGLCVALKLSSSNFHVGPVVALWAAQSKVPSYFRGALLTSAHRVRCLGIPPFASQTSLVLS